MPDYSKMTNEELLALYNQGTSKLPEKLSWLEGTTALGSAAALGSGALHEFVPTTLGLPGDINEVYGKGAEKLKEAMSARAGTSEPVTNAPAEGAVAKGAPLVKPEPSIPTSAGWKKSITDIIPEYEPKSVFEKFMKTAGANLPMMAMGPESAIPRITTGPGVFSRAMGRGAVPFARYAAGPAAAAEGVSQIPGMQGSEYEPWARMAASLAGPGVVSKFITPNPASKASIDAQKALKDSGFNTRKYVTAGQLSDNDRVINREAWLSNLPFSGSKGASVENKAATNAYSQNAFRQFLGEDVNPGENLTDAVRRSNARADAEYERITRLPAPTGGGAPAGRTVGPVYDAQVGKEMDKLVKDYKKQNVLRPSDEPEKLASEVDDLFHSNKVTKWPGWIQGRQYQNLRSKLSNMSADEADPALQRVYGRMRDILDDSMDRVMPVGEENSWKNLRTHYQNNMIMKHALSDTGQMTPESLGQAVKKVVGQDPFVLGQHPMGEYARNGQLLLGKKLPESAGKMDWGLAGILGGQYLLGKAAEHLPAGGSLGMEGLGYGLGAFAAPAATVAGGIPLALAANKFGRGYRSNQVLPESLRPGLMRNATTYPLALESVVPALRKDKDKSP